jgi:hypothetical protein
MNQVFYARIVLIFSVKHTGNQYNSRMYINTSNFNLNEFKSRLLRIEDDALGRKFTKKTSAADEKLVASHEIKAAKCKLICFVQQMKLSVCFSPKTPFDSSDVT